MAAITQPRQAKTENQQTLLVDEKKKTELSTGIAEKPTILPFSNIVKPEVKPAVPVSKPSPEQQTQKPASAQVKGFFPGTISIKQEVNVKPVEEKDVDIDIFDTDSDEFLNSKSLNIEDVEEAWKEFAEKIAQGQPNLMSTLLSSKPYLGDGFEVKFEVKNSIQEKEIDLVKGEMALFLRERLNNRFIRIKIEINLNVENFRPYRPEEIFKHMAEKNPAIIKLRQRFGLEPDY
jgi:DNA polymerase-3 subunit gamma/tau